MLLRLEESVSICCLSRSSEAEGTSDSFRFGPLSHHSAIVFV
jgi:hypothetical protein